MCVGVVGAVSVIFREKPLCSEQRESDEDLRCAESYRGLDGLSEEINQ